MDTLNTQAQQQADNDALATAVGVAAQELGMVDEDINLNLDGSVGLGDGDGDGDGVDEATLNVFHHELQQPDFGQHTHESENGEKEEGEEVDVSALNLPGDEDMGSDLGLNLDDIDGGEDRPLFSRPPSIRKACDLCHAAKQKCSGDRPTCTRCAAGGWQCNYAPRQRRRTVPKSERTASVPAPVGQEIVRVPEVPRELPPPPPAKKRKIEARQSVAFESTIDLKAAMAALDMGFGEEEGEEMLGLSDDQMLESIAIDGYLADLPLSTFVNNLPYTGPDGNHFNGDDLNGDGFPADIDQHTTSALRDAIFSLNESTKHAHTDADESTEEVDPHVALLDLSHPEQHDPSHPHHQHTNQHDPHDLLELNLGCSHPPLVPHILALLTQHGLEPKAGFSTPLTLSVFAPLARSLRLFQLITDCPTCSTSPQQTLPQLALLSRTTTILTFPFPPCNSSAIGGSAQITIHGARLAGTGISEAIEQHIVGVVWDSWRASIREIFALLDRKAQDVIQASSTGEGLPTTSAETQRAGLFFQAMGRLVTAMDEVEGA